jgi:hypothetical protein
MVTMGILPYQGKIPMVEPGIFFFCCTIVDLLTVFDLFDFLVERVINMGQIILLPLPKEGML